MRGNEARFINHGCTPNLEVRKLQIEGLDEYEVGMFAKRDIKAGEEVSVAD
jgi:SET domain-containing protein